MNCEALACTAKNASCKGTVQNVLMMLLFLKLVNVYELTYVLGLLKLCHENVLGSHTNLQSIKNWKFVVVTKTFICLFKRFSYLWRDDFVRKSKLLLQYHCGSRYKSCICIVETLRSRR